MRLHFLGANRQVTGSRYLLEAGGLSLLIDCGLFQERCCRDRNWAPPPFEPSSIDHVLLTHAHLDHSGLLPRLVRQGYGGPIHSTPASLDLTRLVLEDAARIQEEDAEQKRRRHKREKRRGPHPEVPLYTSEDARDAFKQLRIVPYQRPLELNDRVSARWLDAGHILGSASIELSVREDGRARRIVFSGDVGQWDRVLMSNPTVFPRADHVILESTYGDREHPEHRDVPGALERIVNDTVERGGNVLIPTFAIDRAQELLYYLGELVRAERIPRLTIFLDSPMAISATTIYKRYRHLLDEQARARYEAGEHPFQFPGLHFTRRTSDSQAINNIRGSCIIMAGSGMCTGGRIKHHLRHNIQRPESTVVFVGYQAQDTLGRQILGKPDEVRIHGRMYPVRARIERVEGLSAHADRHDLLRWIGGLTEAPRHVFLTHGEEEAANSLADAIRAEHGYEVRVPAYEDVVELD